MKTITLVLVALALPCAAPAAAQGADARVLLAVGDALEGGRTVVRIHDLDLAPSGRWAAHVDVGLPNGGGEAAVIVVDGSVVVAQGDPLPGGRVVTGVAAARLGDGGELVVKSYARPASSTTPGRGRITIDGVEVLRAGEAVLAPQLPPGATLERIRMFDIAGTTFLLSAEIEFLDGTSFEATLAYDVQSGSLVSPRVLSMHGTAPGGLTRPIDEYLPSIAVARDGSTVTSFVQQWSVDEQTAGLYNGAAAFESGSQAPMGAGEWECVTPRVACAAGAGYLVGGALVCPCGASRGVVASETSILAREGMPLAASPADVVGNFLETEVALAETGEAVFTVPLQGGGQVLVCGDEVLLRTGTSRIDGRIVTRIRHRDLDALDVSEAGDMVLVEVVLEGGVGAVVLLERRTGTVESCSVTPNSTGVIGELRAYGSPFVGANTLRLSASNLPADTFAVALVSRSAGFVPGLGGGSGVLCLGGGVGAVRPAAYTGNDGAFVRAIDLTDLPQPTGAVAAAAGETWRFQVWHRDVGAAGAATTNLTQAVAVTLR